eukprot:TRINITY_DN40_c0_g3_i1.p1 TRINITY_DN40_c0_g3~~TRINITY_DN40_c0_g3_i1.p1  ORF type:complete len:1626 (-),score=289.42 TRINITY_DN40_c0_g3_i1:781-5658(-)
MTTIQPIDSDSDSLLSSSVESLAQLIEEHSTLSQSQIEELIQVLTSNGIDSVRKLSQFPLDEMASLGRLKPKIRKALKDIIPMLNETFRLTELFGVLNLFDDDADYEFITLLIKDELEVDSWDSFLEIEIEDLELIPELAIYSGGIMSIIEFATSFDVSNFLRQVDILRKRRVNTPEDLKEILEDYDKYNEIINKAIIMLSQGVPLSCKEEELVHLKEQMKTDLEVLQASNNTNEMDDQITELVSFTENFELLLNSSMLAKMRSEFSDSFPSHNVTFVGATHVGKSTMIRQLSPPGYKQPAVAARNNYYPTTGNVHVYSSEMRYLDSSLKREHVNLVDIEGSNSPSVPKYVLNSLTSQIRKLMMESNMTERRRRAVSQHLPRFAYVISDVIVYIGEGSWANTEYKDNVVNFAHAAVENVASAIRPCIIIVHNKCNLHEPMDVEVMTEKFLQLHETDDNPILTNLYDQVKCISIPDWYHDQELFDQQIVVLKKLVADLLLLQQKKRMRLGCLLTQVQWCDLLEYVVHNFESKNLRIGTFVGELVSPEHTLAKNAFQYFNTIYHVNRNIKDYTEHFLKCRESTIAMLAVVMISNLRQETQSSSFVQDTIKEKSTSSQYTKFQSEVIDSQLSKWYNILEVLIQLIDNKAPCCAIYEGVKDEFGEEVICTQEYGVHDTHRSPIKVYAIPKSDALFEKLVVGVKKFLGIKVSSVWDGEFQFGGPAPSLENDKIELENLIKEFLIYTSKELFIKNLEIIGTCLRDGISIPDDSCFICQVNYCNRRIVPCGHAFCMYCTDKLLCVSNNCPVCGSEIERVLCYEELAPKTDFIVTSEGLDRIQKQLDRTGDPYKIISLIGRIPKALSSTLNSYSDKRYLKNGSKNYLQNFAFCSKYTGNRSCIYLERDQEETVVIVHYIIDRTSEQICVYPYVSSDVVVLFDQSFKLHPNMSGSHSVVIELVKGKNSAKIPTRMTLDMLVYYLALDYGVDHIDIPMSTAYLKLGSPHPENENFLRIPIPPSLVIKKAYFTLYDWLMMVKGVHSIDPDFIVLFTLGIDSVFKRRHDYFVYTSFLKKGIQFLQILEKKLVFVPHELVSHLTILNIIEEAFHYGINISLIMNLINRLLNISKSLYTLIFNEAKEYYSSSILVWGKSSSEEGEIFPLLNIDVFKEEYDYVLKLLSELQTKDIDTVITLRRLQIFKGYLALSNRSKNKEILDILGKNVTFCIFCMKQNVSLETSLCNHCICSDCWANIAWLDSVPDISDIFYSAVQDKSDAEDDLYNSLSVSMDESYQYGGSSFNLTIQRLILLFRCPVCNCFLMDRLKDYINSDVSLTNSSERSERIIAVLDEAEAGNIILHKSIFQSNLSSLEPFVGSDVHKARLWGNRVAVKYFKPYYIGFQWSRFRREAAILSMLEHEQIVKFYGAYIPTLEEIESSDWEDDSTSLKPFLVFELMSENLNDLIKAANKKLSFPLAIHFAYQISRAIFFLHSMALVHRDIKPSNIVIDRSVPCAKLIDFGESRILAMSEPLTNVGTPFYIAPEVSNVNYSEKVDVYSFGKTLYEMVTKCLNPSALNRSFYEESSIDIPENCPESMSVLIRKCCQENYAMRPDFQFILFELEELTFKYPLVKSQNF